MKRLIWLSLSLVALTCHLSSQAQTSYDNIDDYYRDTVVSDSRYNVFNDVLQKDFEKIYLEDTPINKIYAIRLLLNSPEYFTQGITYLNQIIRKGGFTPSAHRNLVDASKILRECDLMSVKHWYNVVTGQSTIVEKRAFIVAQYFLNEAIMNSRVRLNISSRNEKKFVEALFKSYIFPLPLVGTQVNIIYPKKDEYAFSKWQLVESILVDTLMLNPADVEKIRVIRGQSDFMKRFKNLVLEHLGQAIDQGTFEEELPKLLSDVGVHIENNNPNTNDNLPITPNDPSNKGLISSTVGVLSGVVITPEQKKQLYKLLYNLYKGYVSEDNIPLESYNDTIRLSLLMQLIADPGTIAVDPQLRAFAENIKVEISLGTEDMTAYKELYLATKALADQEKIESCASIRHNSQVVFNLECLYKRSQTSLGMNRKSIHEIVIGMGEKDDQNTDLSDVSEPVVRLVTSIGGEDLERLRAFIMIAKLHVIKRIGDPIITHYPSKIWNFLVQLSEKGNSKFGKSIGGVAKTVDETAVKYAFSKLNTIYDKITIPEKAIYAKYRNFIDRRTLAKRFDYYHKNLESIEKMNKVLKKENKPTLPLGPTSPFTPASKLEQILNKVIILTAIAEVASLTSDMYRLDNISDKRDSIATHGGNFINLAFYLKPGYGTILASWDMLASAAKWLGMENTLYSHDMFAGAINYMMAWTNFASNPTELKLREVEMSYKIPMDPITLENVVDRLEDNNINLNSVFMEATNQAIEGIGRLISGIYFGHRMVNENKVDKYLTATFGKRIGTYEKYYEDFMVSYGKTIKAAANQYPPTENELEKPE